MKIVIMTGVLLAAAAAAMACPVAENDTVAKASPVVRSPGKASAGIEVEYRLAGKAAVGETVRLDIVPQAADTGALVVDVNAPAELGFAARRIQRELAAGATLSLELTPQVHGRFYVNVIVRNAADGDARVVSIPVQVGAVAKRAAKAVTTPDGELIVRLPAAD